MLQGFTLIRVDAPGSDAIFLYTYDDAGNLTSSARCPWTDSDDPTEHGYDEYALYEYNDPNGWGDLLTKYAGNTITYDEIGNPDAIRGWSMEWEHGRQLASMSKGSTEWSFTYNADGLRTKRTNGTKTYTYSYINNQLWYYKVNDQEVFITWDANGLPFSMTTGNSTYYYVTNLQGDVTALMNDAGVIVASYTYTPWGAEDWINPTSGTIAHLNPLRYRGYVFDEETGLYYLQSRYYDPEIGRFINADGLISTGQGLVGNNMFAYCNNNPVLLVDSEGTRPIVGASIQNETELERNQSFNYMNGRSGKHSSQIDLTPDLDNFMQDNAKTLSDYYNKYGFALSFLYFVMSVNDFGPLDIKRQSDWAFDEGTTYYYRGVELRYDDPGNINYGYLGASLFHSAGVSPTISLEILNLGGGGKQVLNHGFTYGNIYTYFDDPRDYNMIRFGFSLYTGG